MNPTSQRVIVSAIILNPHKEVLIMKRADDDDFLPGIWEFPGGTSEFGEDIKDTTVREIKEECGLDIEVGYPFTTAHFTDKGVQYVEVFYFARIVGKPDVTMSKEHSAYQWIAVKDLLTVEFTDYLKKVIKELQESSLLKDL